jgi:hypothetical protein
VKRSWIAIGGIIVALALALGFLGPKPPPPASPLPASPSIQAPGPAPFAKSPPTPVTPSSRIEYSPLAEQLIDPGIPPAEEVQLVQQLFSQYRTALQNRPGPPVGDNQDLVQVLTGRNPLKRPLIPKNSPRIDAAGRLLDRWGQPFHIHAISDRWIEVRSAGPDRRLFTADDSVTTDGDTKPSRDDETASPPGSER